MITEKVYEELDKCITLGVHEDSTNRGKVAEFLRDQTSKCGDDTFSFKEYTVRECDGKKLKSTN